MFGRGPSPRVRHIVEVGVEWLKPWTSLEFPGHLNCAAKRNLINDHQMATRQDTRVPPVTMIDA